MNARPFARVLLVSITAVLLTPRSVVHPSVNPADVHPSTRMIPKQHAIAHVGYTRAPLTNKARRRQQVGQRAAHHGFTRAAGIALTRSGRLRDCWAAALGVLRC